MARGDFERHVRRMRTQYARQRAALLEAIEEYAAGSLRLRDSRTGLHVMVEIPRLPESRTTELIERALASGVALYPASPYYLQKPPTCHAAL